MEQVDERVSIRFEKNEVRAIDKIIKDLGYSSRSDFFRTAVRDHMENIGTRNSISAEVTPLTLEVIDALVDKGFYRSREHALQLALDHYFTEENVNLALKAVESMEITAGKKIDIKLDHPHRQITTK
jgi:metal-responsive CopG/Arc/MetJ family transcriptional regulator